MQIAEVVSERGAGLVFRYQVYQTSEDGVREPGVQQSQTGMDLVSIMRKVIPGGGERPGVYALYGGYGLVEPTEGVVGWKEELGQNEGGAGVTSGSTPHPPSHNRWKRPKDWVPYHPSVDSGAIDSSTGAGSSDASVHAASRAARGVPPRLDGVGGISEHVVAVEIDLAHLDAMVGLTSDQMRTALRLANVRTGHEVERMEEIRTALVMMLQPTPCPEIDPSILCRGVGAGGDPILGGVGTEEIEDLLRGVNAVVEQYVCGLREAYASCVVVLLLKRGMGDFGDDGFKPFSRIEGVPMDMLRWLLGTMVDAWLWCHVDGEYAVRRMVSVAG